MSPFAAAGHAGLDVDWDDGRVVPVLLQHGTQDPMIPAERQPGGLAEALEEHGVPVVYGEYPMGHQVALESVQQGRGVARRRCRGRAADASRVPRPPPEGPVKPVTTATFDDRGAAAATCR